MLPRLRAAIILVAVAAMIGAVSLALRQDDAPEPSVSQDAPPHHAPSAPIEHTAPAVDRDVTEAEAASVTGRLTDRESGEGIPGARLELRPAAGPRDPEYQAMTDSKGRYGFESIPAGRWRLRAEPGPRHLVSAFEAETQLRLETGETRRNVDFDFAPGAAIHGRVVDENDEPVPGAEVFMDGSDAGRRSRWRTDQDGRFVAGPVELFAQVTLEARAGKRVTPTPVPANPQGRRTVEDVTIGLIRGGGLAGVVVDTDREPRHGVDIVVRHESSRMDPRTVSTDDDGHFQVEGLLVGVTVLDIAGHEWPVALAAGETKDGLELVTPRGTRRAQRVEADDREDGAMRTALRGTVFRDEGMPAPNTRLTAFRQGRPLPAPVSADDNGEFRIPAPESALYDIWAYHPDLGVGRVAEARPDSEPVEILLEPAAVLRGRAVDAQTGDPVPAFAITMEFGQESNPFEPEDAPGQVFRNPDGTFEVVSPAPLSKPHRLLVEADGYRPQTADLGELGPGVKKEDIHVALDPGSVVLVRVADTDRRPVAGARVTWRPGQVARRGEFERGGAASLASLSRDQVKYTGVDGTVELRGLPDERVVVNVRHDEHLESHTPVVPSRHRYKTVTVEMLRGGVIAGAVYRGREPYAGAHVRIYRRAEHTEAYSDPEGRFRLEGIPEGEALVELTVHQNGSHRADHNYQRRVYVVEGETTRLDFQIPEGYGGLEGYVMQDGVPLSNVTVAAMIETGAGESVRTGRTGEDGWYEIEGIPAGPIRVGTVSSSSDDSQWALIEDTVIRADYIRRHDIDLRVEESHAGQVTNIPADTRSVYVLVLEGTMEGPFFNLDDRTLSHSVRHLTTVDEFGAFTTPPLEEGAYTLVAIAEPADANADAIADGDVNHTYRHIEIAEDERISLDIGF